MAGGDVLFIVAAIVLALIIWLFVPSWMIRRSVPKVISIFRKKNAVGIKNAKTLEELGLGPKALMERMFGRRDYKPRALQLLVETKVVMMTEDGKFYITEQTVASATWIKRKKDDSIRGRLSGGQ